MRRSLRTTPREGAFASFSIAGIGAAFAESSVTSRAASLFIEQFTDAFSNEILFFIMKL
jgi:hypothetical protein